MANQGPFTRLPRPPHPTRGGEIDPHELRKWFDRIWYILSGIPGIGWDIVSKAGSSLYDIETRPHNVLQDRDALDSHPWDAINKTGSDLEDIETRLHNVLQDRDALDSHPWDAINKTGSSLSDIEEWRLGDILAGNYSEFEADGTYVAKGDATTFDDLQGSILTLKTKGTRLVINDAENTLEFATNTNLTDYAFDNYQVRHTWLIGSVIKPHIHWEQNQNAVPNFLLRYRWQVQGAAKTTAWTNYPLLSIAFTYVSGTLNQIAFGPGITPPVGAGLSDVIELRIIRDNANGSGVFAGADPYTGDASLTFADIHLEEDTLGSRQEYIK